MRIVNHQGCAFDLYSVRLEPGENIVDDGLWEEHFAKLPDKLKTAYFGGPRPLISIAGDGGEQLAMSLEREAEREHLSAKDKINEVMKATQPEHLEALAQGETRKTVKAAIQKRAKQMAEEIER